MGALRRCSLLAVGTMTLLWAACDPGSIDTAGDDPNNPKSELGTTGDIGFTWDLGTNPGWDYKLPPKPPPSKEVCNGFDDDQDGQVDEGCGCTPGKTQECFPYAKMTIQGICKKGQQTCSGTSEFGTWGACTGAVLPQKEKCGDKIDQDCDGKDLPCPPKKNCEGFLFGISARPVDIVWIIDQSGSMSQEIAGVKQNMNNFAKSIASSKNDYRVIVLARRGTGSKDICIPPPLGGSNCGDSTRFKQVSKSVGSTNELSLYMSYASQIEAFMRPTSLRLLVVVTDDNSSVSATAFHTWIKKRTGYNDYVFHSIVSVTKDWCTAKVGSVYKDLTTWTKGSWYHICSANWTTLFQSLGKNAGNIAKNKYKLAKTPIAGSITVSYNGNPKKKGVDWDWDSANNQVILKGNLPPQNAKILVCYKYN